MRLALNNNGQRILPSKINIMTKINDLIAKRNLKNFYKNRNPNNKITNDEKIFLIANMISSRYGRKLLAKAMVEPLSQTA